MNITELIKIANGANIIVQIDLKDLREWHQELMTSKLKQIEQLNAERLNDNLLTPEEACERLMVTRSTLTRWQKSGYLVPLKIGSKCRYQLSKIDKIIGLK